MPNVMFSEDRTLVAATETVSSGGRLVTAQGHALPLRATHLSAQAGGGIARVVLQQRFVNDHDAPLLVHYQLPLPADGAISGFRFVIDGRTVTGEVDTLELARERFERALVEGRTAGMLSQRRSNQFDQSVGNVPPGAQILCEVVVDQKLAWLPEGAWEWRFPTVLGPRYMGQPGRVPDAGALNVPFVENGIGTRAALTLSIRGATGTASSPSHNIGTEPDGEAMRVDFHDAHLDRDIVVRWPAARPEVGATLSVARPHDGRHDGKQEYGLLTLVPPDPSSDAASLSRDLVLLIDTSGSMGGAPLAQAARVASAIVESLSERDRLEMVEFSTVPTRWRDAPVAATLQAKREAVHWLRSLQAGGATEMYDGLKEALRPLRADAQRQVVLITDGFIGFDNEILQLLLEKLPENSRLHTLGVGSAPNRSLTGPAARAGRGVEVIVGTDEEVEPAAARLLARTCAPLVTELVIEGEGINIASTCVPDLYANAPVLISLALSPETRELVVRGKTATGEYVQQVDVPTDNRGEEDASIAALYGRERIEELEMRRAGSATAERWDTQIEQTGLRFQIASRLTAWVAVDPEVTSDGERKPVEEVMPHEIPYGTSVEGFGLRRASDVSSVFNSLFSETFGAGIGARRDESVVVWSCEDRSDIQEEIEYASEVPMPKRTGMAGRQPEKRRGADLPTEQDDTPEEPEREAARPRRWRLVALLVASLLAIALLTWFATRADASPPASSDSPPAALQMLMAEAAP